MVKTGNREIVICEIVTWLELYSHGQASDIRTYKIGDYIMFNGARHHVVRINRLDQTVTLSEQGIPNSRSGAETP